MNWVPAITDLYLQLRHLGYMEMQPCFKIVNYVVF